MLGKYRELHPHTIVAYNVDSITTKQIKVLPAIELHIGGFKYEQFIDLKPHYMQLQQFPTPSEVGAGNFRLNAPALPYPPNKHMLIFGPGGIGKTVTPFSDFFRDNGFHLVEMKETLQIYTHATPLSTALSLTLSEAK